MGAQCSLRALSEAPAGSRDASGKPDEDIDRSCPAHERRGTPNGGVSGSLNKTVVEREHARAVEDPWCMVDIHTKEPASRIVGVEPPLCRERYVERSEPRRVEGIPDLDTHPAADRCSPARRRPASNGQRAHGVSPSSETHGRGAVGESKTQASDDRWREEGNVERMEVDPSFTVGTSDVGSNVGLGEGRPRQRQLEGGGTRESDTGHPERDESDPRSALNDVGFESAREQCRDDVGVDVPVKSGEFFPPHPEQRVIVRRRGFWREVGGFWWERCHAERGRPASAS